MGGVAITGSKWTTSGTNIYYNTGNVGIGTTTTSDVDDNTAFAIPTVRLYVRGGDSVGGTCDVVIKGGNFNGSNGKARLWLTANNGHSSYIQSEHTGYGDTQLTFGTANGNVLPTERMRIRNNGAVGIQTNGYGIPNNFMTAGSLTIGNIDTNYGTVNNWTANTAGLMLECLNNTEIVIHDANNSLHSFMTYFTNGTFRIGRNMGYGVGNVYMSGFLNVESYLVVSGTIQALNSYYFANNLWNNSNEGEVRIYFAQSSTTYIRGAGSTFGTSITFRVPNQADMAYFTANVLYCYGPVNLSDRRIKRDIEEINDETALNMILQVQPTTYYYRDEARNRGNGKVYGFIAQQIKEVIPDVVHTTKEIIANIYKTCLI